MYTVRVLPLFASLLLLLAPFAVSASPERAPCTFKLGFQTLHELAPFIVGDCVEDEHQDRGTGNTVQATTRGLLVWRRADNWTAFTDGSTTWLNGPCGLQSRGNAEILDWEVGGSCPGSAPATNSLTQAPGFIAATTLPCSFEGVMSNRDFGWPVFSFSGNDERLYMWITLHDCNVHAPKTAKWTVYDPNGLYFTSDENKFLIGNWETISRGLSLRVAPLRETPGLWSARVDLDGGSLGYYYFRVS